MTALTAGLDLRGSLRRVVRAGAAFVPEALAEGFRRRLHAEVAAGVFEALPSEMGPYRVRTEADLLSIGNDDGAYPGVAELRREFVRLVRRHGEGVAGVGDWYPNDTAVQRYQVGSVGVSPHRDGKKYRYLVAVFTVQGHAEFATCRDRGGAVLDQWDAGPGSLVLLRAPGLAGVEDGRPFHTVAGPTDGPRTSVTFRMSTQNAPPGESAASADRFREVFGPNPRDAEQTAVYMRMLAEARAELDARRTS